MADTKIVGGRGLTRAEPNPGKGHHNKKHHDKGHHDHHGCSCHVDHQTIGGSGSKHHPFEVIGFPDQPPYPPTEDVPLTKTIFVRPNGSDTHGNGTLTKPFATFVQGAQLLKTQPPGQKLNLDITDIVETLPPGYQLPFGGAPVQLWSDGSPSTLPFRFAAAINILATPRAFFGTTSADDVLVGDIVSITSTTPGLAIVTVATPRPEWAANGALTAIVVGSAGDARLNCQVFASDATHLFLCNTPSEVPPQNLSLVTQSATLTGSAPGTDGGGLLCADMSSIAFQGLRLRIVGGGSADQVSLVLSKAVQPVLEMCDIDGLSLNGVSTQALMSACTLRNFFNTSNSAWSPVRSLVLNAGFFVYGGGPHILRQTVFQGCDPLGPGAFATAKGALSSSGWELKNCDFEDSTGPAINAALGGSWSLEDVEINGAAGDALVVDGPKLATLQHVTGTGSTGTGVNAQRGAQVQITDATTDVTGAGGNLQCGSLPVRTYVDFRTNAPINDWVDIQFPPVLNAATGVTTPPGEETTGPGTGGSSLTRIFQQA